MDEEMADADLCDYTADEDANALIAEEADADLCDEAAYEAEAGYEDLCDEAADTDLCGEAADEDLCDEAADADLCGDAADEELCGEAADDDLFEEAADEDLCDEAADKAADEEPSDPIESVDDKDLIEAFDAASCEDPDGADGYPLDLFDQFCMELGLDPLDDKNVHPELDDAAVPSLAEPSFASIVGMELACNPPPLIPYARGQRKKAGATVAADDTEEHKTPPRRTRAKCESTTKARASFKRSRSKIGSRIWSGAAASSSVSPKKGKKPLKMTHKHIYSRTFHATVNKLAAEGYTKENANIAARSTAKAAAIEWELSAHAG